MAPKTSQSIHANCVAIDGKGLVILGASGAGKSTLTLQLMALGAVLVADDQTTLTLTAKGLIAESPPSIFGLIEARNVGILTVDSAQSVVVKVVVDLDKVEALRLPQSHVIKLLGVSLPCLHNVDSPAFPSALLHYMKQDRQNEI